MDGHAKRGPGGPGCARARTRLAPLPAAAQGVGVVVGEPSAHHAQGRWSTSSAGSQNNWEEVSRDEAPEAIAEWQVSRREEKALATEVEHLDAALVENQAALRDRPRWPGCARPFEAERVMAARLTALAHAEVDDARDHVREVAVLAYTGQGQLDLAAPHPRGRGHRRGPRHRVHVRRGVVGNIQRARVERLTAGGRAVGGPSRRDAEAARDRTGSGESQAPLANRQAQLGRDHRRPQGRGPHQGGHQEVTSCSGRWW